MSPVHEFLLGKKKYTSCSPEGFTSGLAGTADARKLQDSSCRNGRDGSKSVDVGCLADMEDSISCGQISCCKLEEDGRFLSVRLSDLNVSDCGGLPGAKCPRNRPGPTSQFFFLQLNSWCM